MSPAELILLEDKDALSAGGPKSAGNLAADDGWEGAGLSSNSGSSFLAAIGAGLATSRCAGSSRLSAFGPVGGAMVVWALDPVGGASALGPVGGTLFPAASELPGEVVEDADKVDFDCSCGALQTIEGAPVGRLKKLPPKAGTWGGTCGPDVDGGD